MFRFDMNPVADMISEVLRAIFNQFYADRPRDYLRDERALTRAISRYGWECEQRGWHLETQFILRDLVKLLIEIKRTDADISYLPVYLEGAIKRHIGQRAEELQAAARATPRKVSTVVKVLAGLPRVEAVREPTAVEQLGLLYSDLRRRARKPKQMAKPAVQPSLL
jgi:hypothetical protein